MLGASRSGGKEGDQAARAAGRGLHEGRSPPRTRGPTLEPMGSHVSLPSCTSEPSSVRGQHSGVCQWISVHCKLTNWTIDQLVYMRVFYAIITRLEITNVPVLWDHSAGVRWCNALKLIWCEPPYMCYFFLECFIIIDVIATCGENKNGVCKLTAILTSEKNEKKAHLCFQKSFLVVTAIAVGCVP